MPDTIHVLPSESENPQSMCYAFGGSTPDQIYQYICDVVDDSEYVVINKRATVTSITFFESVVFRIRVNSKTQCLDTENAIAFEYISDIAGASATKTTAHIPLVTTKESVPHIRNMLQDIYENRRSQVSGETFGCCNDHIRCSDAGYCLHLKDREYWGCSYRRNLEAGRIFYGKNRNYGVDVPAHEEKSKERYIVFDVETPNAANDRISAIGIVVLEDAQPVREYYSIIDPETHFDEINIKLTKITPEMVKGKPTFPKVWTEIKSIMESGLLIAHNAPFDMSVLAKTLNGYQIEWMPFAYYSCTCVMGRKLGLDVPNYRLNTLCDAYGIALDCHHNALSDAKACAGILKQYLQLGLDPNDYIRNYDMLNQHSVKENHTKKLKAETVQLLSLKSLLKDISDDGMLSPLEIGTLQSWLHENDNLKGMFPFDRVFDIVEDALADGKLDNSELQDMLALFEKITDPLAHTSCCEKISIEGKTFCLSGDFNYGSKSDVETYFLNRGGISSKSITKKTDYLIVGSQGSAYWSSGNYGNKVKKAMELQEKGIPIQIIKEEDIM